MEWSKFDTRHSEQRFNELVDGAEVKFNDKTFDIEFKATKKDGQWAYSDVEQKIISHWDALADGWCKHLRQSVRKQYGEETWQYKTFNKWESRYAVYIFYIARTEYNLAALNRLGWNKADWDNYYENDQKVQELKAANCTLLFTDTPFNPWHLFTTNQNLTVYNSDTDRISKDPPYFAPTIRFQANMYHDTYGWGYLVGVDDDYYEWFTKPDGTDATGSDNYVYWQVFSEVELNAECKGDGFTSKFKVHTDNHGQQQYDPQKHGIKGKYTPKGGCVSITKLHIIMKPTTDPHLLRFYIPKNLYVPIPDIKDYSYSENPFEFTLRKQNFDIIPRPQGGTTLYTNYNIYTNGIVTGQNLESFHWGLSDIGNDCDVLKSKVSILEEDVMELAMKVDQLEREVKSINQFINIQMIADVVTFGLGAAGTFLGVAGKKVAQIADDMAEGVGETATAITREGVQTSKKFVKTADKSTAEIGESALGEAELAMAEKGGNKSTNVRTTGVKTTDTETVGDVKKTTESTVTPTNVSTKETTKTAEGAEETAETSVTPSQVSTREKKIDPTTKKPVTRQTTVDANGVKFEKLNEAGEPETVAGITSDGKKLQLTAGKTEVTVAPDQVAVKTEGFDMNVKKTEGGFEADADFGGGAVTTHVEAKDGQIDGTLDVMQSTEEIEGGGSRSNSAVSLRKKGNQYDAQLNKTTIKDKDGNVVEEQVSAEAGINPETGDGHVGLMVTRDANGNVTSAAFRAGVQGDEKFLTIGQRADGSKIFDARLGENFELDIMKDANGKSMFKIDGKNGILEIAGKKIPVGTILKLILGGMAVYDTIKGFVKKPKTGELFDETADFDLDGYTSVYEYGSEGGRYFYRVDCDIITLFNKKLDGWVSGQFSQWSEKEAKLIDSIALKPILADIDKRIKILEQKHDQLESNDPMTLLERLEMLEKRQDEFELRLSALEART
jgi:hypothetical protein